MSVRPRTLAAAAGAALAGGCLSLQAANARLRRWEYLDPNTIERPGSMFYLRGLGIHMIERGTGPALLLIHGFGGSTFSFRHQLGMLAEQFRVLAPDLPGFGYSDRPTDLDLSLTAQVERLREFMDRMDVERATVLGHAMGGEVAMRLAVAHPERVERLVIVAGPEPDRRRRIPLPSVARPFLPVILALFVARERRLRREIERIVYDRSTVTEEVCRGYLRPLRLRGTAASLQKLVGDIGRDAPLDPATVGQRTLLLWGDSDPVAPLRVAHRFHAAMPDARLEVIPRAGHLVLEEQPDLCNRSLSAFLGAPLPVTMPSPVRS